MKDWRTYKLNLTIEQESFLHNRKKQKGIGIGYTISDALTRFINTPEQSTIESFEQTIRAIKNDEYDKEDIITDLENILSDLK